MGRTLAVAYDRATSPVSYDFLSALLHFEMRRIDGNFSDIDLNILPGPREGFRDDRLPPTSTAARQRMFDEVVLPMAHMLPSVRRVFHPTTRCDALYAAGRRVYGTPHLVAAAKRGLYPLRVEHGDPCVRRVTITLRESEYWPTRNSDLVQWAGVATWLRKNSWLPVIVRDTERAGENFYDFVSCWSASVDLMSRARLYLESKLNLFVNNGPAWLSLFLGAPTAIFKLTARHAPCCDEDYFRGCGFAPGAPWPNLRPMQHVSWEPDRADRIIPVIEQMLEQRIAA